MESFEMTVEIDRPPDEVFAFVSDLENDPRWRREWVDAKRTSVGPIGVGTTSSLFARFLGRRTEAVYEITEYDSGRAVRWKTVRGPLPLMFWRSVERSGEGTLVTMGYAGDFSGLLGLVRPLLASLGRRALSGDLPTLKHLLESRSA
jgi:ligand-binding SRPBCC domain-containing protein